MRFAVHGLKRDTGTPGDFIIDAANERDAAEQAAKRGYVVEQCKPIREPDPPALPPPPPPPPAPPMFLPPMTRGQGVWVLILLVCVLLMQSIAMRGPRYEYKIAAPSDDTVESDLIQWGDAGWEVVTARRVTSGDYLTPARYEMILRRRK